MIARAGQKVKARRWKSAAPLTSKHRGRQQASLGLGLGLYAGLSRRERCLLLDSHQSQA